MLKELNSARCCVEEGRPHERSPVLQHVLENERHLLRVVKGDFSCDRVRILALANPFARLPNEAVDPREVLPLLLRLALSHAVAVRVAQHHHEPDRLVEKEQQLQGLDVSRVHGRGPGSDLQDVVGAEDGGRAACAVRAGDDNDLRPSAGNRFCFINSRLNRAAFNCNVDLRRIVI